MSTHTNDFDFICKHCGESSVISISNETFRKIYDNVLDVSELSGAEREIKLAMHSLHTDCFDEILEEYKGKVKPGAYVSTNTFDDDEYRDVPVFLYVHKELLDNHFEIWEINTSSRYARKGGEFLSKSVASFEQAVLYFNGMMKSATNEPVNVLRDVLETYAKNVRKDFLKNIVEATTDAIAEDPLFVYDEITIMDDYRKFLDECEELENTLRVAKHI